MRTNPRSGSPKGGSIVPRVPRRRSQGEESVALTADSDQVPVDNSRDQIARLAYALWEARGGNGGSAEEDWYRAEQEILARSRA